MKITSVTYLENRMLPATELAPDYEQVTQTKIVVADSLDEAIEIIAKEEVGRMDLSGVTEFRGRDVYYATLQRVISRITRDLLSHTTVSIPWYSFLIGWAPILQDHDRAE